jgi:hypothetical protein
MSDRAQPPVDPANQVVVQVDLKPLSKQPSFAIQTDPPPPWITITQNDQGEWIFTITTGEGIQIDFAPGEGLSAITGLSFTPGVQPSAFGAFAAGAWQRKDSDMLLLDDGGNDGKWDFTISARRAVRDDGLEDLVFDPKIYNEGSGG